MDHLTELKNQENSVYVQRFIRKIIDESEANVWDSAVFEWEIVECKEDRSANSSCICGKKHIRYLYTIRNKLNGNELEPIGSKNLLLMQICLIYLLLKEMVHCVKCELLI